MRRPESFSDVGRAESGNVLRSIRLRSRQHITPMPQPGSVPPPVSAPDAPPRAGFFRVLAAVFASFLGIRKKAAGERDATSIKPLHVIVAGLLGAAILAAAVLTLVRVITHPG
jgi:hypothetical protein